MRCSGFCAVHAGKSCSDPERDWAGRKKRSDGNCPVMSGEVQCKAVSCCQCSCWTHEHFTSVEVQVPASKCTSTSKSKSTSFAEWPVSEQWIIELELLIHWWMCEHHVSVGEGEGWLVYNNKSDWLNIGEIIRPVCRQVMFHRLCVVSWNKYLLWKMYLST